MSSRKSNDSTSSSGVSYPAGSASTPAVKGVNYSQMQDAGRALLKNGAYNGHAVEVYADGAVWDTVSGVYLYPGRDFHPHDIQRS